MEPNFFPMPKPTDKLWRYLGFPELINLLSRKTLHFTRPDNYTDRFEGSSSVFDWRRKVKAVDPEAYEAEWRELRRSVAISCWHMSEHESVAMWQLYANRGMAIQTTYERLNRAILDGSGIIPGVVEYADHATSPMNTPSAVANFYRKRQGFAHEREFRLTTTRYHKTFIGPGGKVYDALDRSDAGFRFQMGAVPESGIDQAIDPEVLIQNLYVAPDSPPWFLTTVQDLVSAMGSKAPVKPSSLDVSPIY